LDKKLLEMLLTLTSVPGINALYHVGFSASNRRAAAAK